MRKPAVLVACECSGVVRDAFIAAGCEAISCDLKPTESPGPHYQGDVFHIIDYPWSLVIAHPFCTHSSVSGALHFKQKKMDGRFYCGAAFFMRLVRATEHVDRTCFEHPVSVMATLYRKCDCIIQPWQHGHGETKTTCLWLKNLPNLEPSNIVEGREQRVHKMTPSETRSTDRSRTYQGIAAAMANQWAHLLFQNSTGLTGGT
jgi:hypothetical protein